MFASATVHAVLPATDFARALSWYSHKLGLEPVERNDEGQAAWFDAGGSRFLVYGTQFAGTNQATAAAFNVADLDGAMSALRKNGVTFEDYDFGDFKTEDGVMTMPDGTKAAWFKDSEGNTLALGAM
ncbi:MAG: hypothetical protein A2Z12_06470 [Actinobacteria bacterium RBG_16_68_21]|nr:MAG: hypothetical protein A2Z12_06470 [Actinobacteria bacterium RBG_16_68_21]